MQQASEAGLGLLSGLLFARLAQGERDILNKLPVEA
jgi:hypothetical protein